MSTKVLKRDNPVVAHEVAYLTDIVAQSGTYISAGADDTILTNVADLDSAVEALRGLVNGSEGSLASLGLTAESLSSATTVVGALDTLAGLIAALDSGNADAIENIYDIIGTSDSSSIFSGTYTSEAGNLVAGIEALDTALAGVQEDLTSAESDIDNLQAFVGTTGSAAGASWASLDYVGSDDTVIAAIAKLDSATKAAADAAEAADSAAVARNIYLTSAAGTGDVLKTYTISQGSTSATATTVGTIDIPVDFLVKSGSVSTVTAADKAAGGKFEDNDGFEVGDKYLDFVVNTVAGTGTDQHMYINTKDLVDVYTAEQSASQIQLAVSASNVISGEIVDGSVDASALGTSAVETAKINDLAVTTAKIAASAVETAKIADSAVTTAKIADHAIDGTKLALIDSVTSASYTLTVADGRLSLTPIA